MHCVRTSRSLVLPTFAPSMQRLEIRLSLSAVAPLLQRLEPLVDQLRESLANPVTRVCDDPDFVELWSTELLEGQREDLTALASLFDEEFHKSGRIQIDQENADAILRACAALRLRLRETELGFATDAQLESGEPDFDTMTEHDHVAYGCYMVLATLQEIIIDNLDLSMEPGAEDSAEDGDEATDDEEWEEIEEEDGDDFGDDTEDLGDDEDDSEDDENGDAPDGERRR